MDDSQDEVDVGVEEEEGVVRDWDSEAGVVHANQLELMDEAEVASGLVEGTALDEDEVEVEREVGEEEEEEVEEERAEEEVSEEKRPDTEEEAEWAAELARPRPFCW